MDRPSIARPEIERIVREVLRRLLAQGAVPSVDRVPPRPAPNHRKPLVRPTPQPLELVGNVISLSQVEGGLQGIQQVTVGANAVVTPSVRDYLKQHDVQLSVRTPEGHARLGAMLWLASFATRFDTQALSEQLGRQGVSCRVLSDSSLAAIATQLARRLDGQATAVILTSEPEVANCVVNRHRSLRGFVAADLATLTKAQSATGGNLLIVDPTTCSEAEICELACDMATRTPSLPPAWRGVL